MRAVKKTSEREREREIESGISSLRAHSHVRKRKNLAEIYRPVERCEQDGRGSHGWWFVLWSVE